YPETRDYVTRVLYHYDGTTNGGVSAPPAPVYRTVGEDGTIVYTNIPPRGRRYVVTPRAGDPTQSHGLPLITLLSSQPLTAAPIPGRRRRFSTHPQCE